MKKNKGLLLLVSLLALTGCGKNSESVEEKSDDSINQDTTSEVKEDILTKQVIDSLSNKVMLESVIKDDSNLKSYAIQTAFMDKQFAITQYSDDKFLEDDKTYKEYYTSNGVDNDSNIYATRLQVNNKLKYYKVYNPSSGNYYRWEDGYEDVFRKLNVSDFTRNDYNSFSLKDDVISNKDRNHELSTLVYGNPGYDVTSFTLYFDDDENIKIDSKAKFTSSNNTYQYSSVGSIKDFTIMPNVISPLENVVDIDFDNIKSKLHQRNYICTLTEDNLEDNTKKTIAIIKAAGDRVLFSGDGLPLNGIGFARDGDKYVQEYIKNSQDEYVKGTREEGSLNIYFPTIDIASSCFTRTDGYNSLIYTMKDGLEGDSTVYTPLEHSLEELYHFEFQYDIDKDIIYMSNKSNKYYVLAQFEDIGKTTLPF